MESVYIEILRWGLWLVIVVLLVRSVKDKGRERGDFRVAEYPWPMKIMVLLFSILIGVLTSKSILDPRDMDTFDWVAMVALNTVAILSMLEFFIRRINYTDNKMTSYSPWAGVREFNYSDFTIASYSETLQWHKFITNDKRSVYVHDYLSGSPEIVSNVLKDFDNDRK
jgi:cbb3-type cytochrome oxidase subunit 1